MSLNRYRRKIITRYTDDAGREWILKSKIVGRSYTGCPIPCVVLTLHTRNPEAKIMKVCEPEFAGSEVCIYVIREDHDRLSVATEALNHMASTAWRDLVTIQTINMEAECRYRLKLSDSRSIQGHPGELECLRLCAFIWKILSSCPGVEAKLAFDLLYSRLRGNPNFYNEVSDVKDIVSATKMMMV